MKRSTIAALAVLAALGAYIYWFERGPVREAEAERVFDVEQTAIVRIELRDHDDVPVVAEKTAEGWRLQSPVTADADATEMDLLTQNLATLGFQRAVARASEVELSDYGLEAPSVRVRFVTEDGETLGIDFGSDTPTTGNQYARRKDGEDILVVASYLSLNYQKTAWDLRDKSLFHVADDAEPRRIEIERRDEPKLVLARDDGRWLVEEPLRARADRLETEGLVTRFRRAAIAEVLSETPAGASDTGLAEPRRRLRVDFEGDVAPLVLEVGNERGAEAIAQTPSRTEIFLIDASLVDDLSRAPTDFVSKKLFEGPTFEVTRLRVDGREIEKRASGTEETWDEIAPETRELTEDSVMDLLFELSATSAESVLSPGPDLGAPAHRIALTRGDAGHEDVLQIWTPEGDLVYARRQGDDVVLELTREAWAKVESLLGLAPEAPPNDEP